MKKQTDRTKTTPEIHQQIKEQAAKAKMKIAPYLKMILDNDKNKTDSLINFNCSSHQEVLTILSKIDGEVTLTININPKGK